MRLAFIVAAATLLTTGCGGVGMPPAIDATPVQAPAEVAALTVRVTEIKGEHLRMEETSNGVDHKKRDDDVHLNSMRAALTSTFARVGCKVVADGEPADITLSVEYVRMTYDYPGHEVLNYYGSARVEREGSVIDTLPSANSRGGILGEAGFAGSIVNAMTSSKNVLAVARAPRNNAPATPPTTVAAGSPATSGAPTPAAPQTTAGAASYTVAAPQPSAYALIIGIETYRDVPSPTGARGDAEKFAKLAKQTLGVPESHIKLALDDRATKGDIEKHLEWLKTNAQPGSRIYFFFSGHGAPEPSTGTSYVLPYDGDPRYLDGTALRLQTILGKLQDTKAREVLAVMDSCFSGAGGRSVLPPGARALVRVQAPPSGARIALFSAASGAETSGPAPGAPEGLFTQMILEGLGRGQADMNGDGQVSLEELRDWVKPRVTREAKRDHRDQTPNLFLGNNVGTAGNFIVAWGLATK